MGNKKEKWQKKTTQGEEEGQSIMHGDNAADSKGEGTSARQAKNIDGASEVSEGGEGKKGGRPSQGRAGEERIEKEGREVGGAAVEWVGAKYSRERLMELSKCALALRRPPGIPLEFCKGEPDNLAERSKIERAARRKEERDKEKERKEKNAKGGRESRGEGEATGRLGRGDIGRELAAVGRGGHPHGGPGSQPGLGLPAAGRGGALAAGHMSAADRHRMMQEEVERERAAFAATRNQQKADDVARRTAAGIPTNLDVNRSVFGNSMGSMSCGDDGGGQITIDMLFERGRSVGGDDITAGIGEMSIQIPLPSVVPPEASPSKFAKSRAGRWFSSAPDSTDGGGMGLSDPSSPDAALRGLWGAPAARPSELNAPQMPQQAAASPMGLHMHQMQQAGGMPAPFRGVGGPAPTPQSTLSQLLSITAADAAALPGSTSTPSGDERKMNLPLPLAPLARPGNR
jgi:hypothetical protein